MQWLSNIVAAFTGASQDIDSIKSKVQTADQSTLISDQELSAYIDNLEERSKKIVKDLKKMYSEYGITFSGFKSLDAACDSLRESLKDGKDLAYNNLIKLESAITTEQKRHLALIRIAMSKDGKRVIDLINSNPKSKAIFIGVFGERDVAGKENVDGSYQRIWSEIHKLSEYIILQKNKVYH